MLAAAFPLQLPATSATVDVRVDADSSFAGGRQAAAASKVGAEASHASFTAGQGCCRRYAGQYLCMHGARQCQAEQTAGLHSGQCLTAQVVGCTPLADEGLCLSRRPATGPAPCGPAPGTAPCCCLLQVDPTPAPPSSMSAEEAAERGGKLLPAPPLVARGDKMLSFLIEKWGFKEPVSCSECARLMPTSVHEAPFVLRLLAVLCRCHVAAQLHVPAAFHDACSRRAQAPKRLTAFKLHGLLVQKYSEPYVVITLVGPDGSPIGHPQQTPVIQNQQGNYYHFGCTVSACKPDLDATTACSELCQPCLMSPCCVAMLQSLLWLHFKPSQPCSTSSCCVATPQHMLPSSARIVRKAYRTTCLACTLIASGHDPARAAWIACHRAPMCCTGISLDLPLHSPSTSQGSAACRCTFRSQ